MKVTFITNLYPPNQVGGYEELCWQVASRFVELGNEVSVVTSAYGGKVASWPGQKVDQTLRLLIGKTIYDHFVGDESRRRVLVDQNIHALKECVSSRKPDVIFCWNLFGLQSDVLEFLGELDIPVVMMLTDNWLASMLNPEYVGTFFRESVYGSVDEDAYLSAPSRALFSIGPNISAVFGSHYMKRFYSASGIHFANDVVVHNGVPLEEISLAASLWPREAKKVDLLFASRMVEIKGAHLAVEGLSILKDERPDINWNLELVGDCSDKNYVEEVMRLAKKLDVYEWVSLRGRVAADKLNELFRSKDVYLFPSLYEPFSLTLIHALGAGIPTVASDIGGNTEIVSHRDTGLLFKAKDARSLARSVIEFVDQPSHIHEVKINGARRAKEFSAERMVEGMLTHLKARAGLVDA